MTGTLHRVSELVNLEDKPEENVRANLPLRATRQNQTEGSSLVFTAAWEPQGW